MSRFPSTPVVAATSLTRLIENMELCSPALYNYVVNLTDTLSFLSNTASDQSLVTSTSLTCYVKLIL